MIIEAKLYKKYVTYTDKSGEKKRTVNFYVNVGSENIPIEVVFFPNPKCEGRDPAYSNRCAVLEAVCELIPSKLSAETQKQANAGEAAGSAALLNVPTGNGAPHVS